MTRLEALITEAVAEATAHTLTRHTERLAEGMIEELMRDADFRAEMLALIRTAFRHAIVTLDEPR